MAKFVQQANESLTIASFVAESSVTAGLDHVQSGEAFMAGYELGKVIGRGAFSVVRLARRKVDGIVFASKIINKLAVVKKKRLRDEIRILVSVRHENVVALREIFETQRELLLVMDLATGGELFDRIVQKEKYSEREASEVVASLLQAVVFLHQQKIIHRDIKPENILLANTESDTQIKLSDFGLAKLFEPDEEEMDCDDGGAAHQPMTRLRAYTNCGTDYYVAPEVRVEKCAVLHCSALNTNSLHRVAGTQRRRLRRPSRYVERWSGYVHFALWIPAIF